jgi:hypothetical protein
VQSGIRPDTVPDIKKAGLSGQISGASLHITVLSWKLARMAVPRNLCVSGSSTHSVLPDPEAASPLIEQKITAI